MLVLKPIINVKTIGMYFYIKRIIDLLISIFFLLAFSPLLLLIAFLIKIDSDGPVFFRQTRIGYKGNSFSIYKFRTMINRKAGEIDQYNESVVKQNNDTRVTKLGQYLRVSSLDELPQMFNIFLGNMSLIGPRPVLPEQQLVVPSWYRARFNVLPGITGLAQVMGRRGLSWEEQLIYDCDYVKKVNVGLDLYILYRTFVVVLLRKNIFGEEGKNWRSYQEMWKDK